MKRCPLCGGQIQEEAARCRHCGGSLEQNFAKPDSPPAGTSARKLRWFSRQKAACALMAVIVLVCVSLIESISKEVKIQHTKVEPSKNTPAEEGSRAIDREPAPVALQQLTVEAADSINSYLPATTADGDLRIDAVVAQGSSLTYYSTFLQYKASQIPADYITQSLYKGGREAACNSMPTSQLLDLGGTITHVYRGNDNNLIISFSIRKCDCQEVS